MIGPAQVTTREGGQTMMQLRDLHPLFVLSVPLVMTFAATWFDLLRREIPDWIPMVVLAWAMMVAATGASGSSWEPMIAGFLVACGVSLIGYLLHFGGGDIKLVAALGAAIGAIGGVVSVLVFVFAVCVSGAV